jgi:hypothetical protein
VAAGDALDRLRHARDVALERVEVDDEGRRVDIFERNFGGGGRRQRHAEPF